MRQSVESTTVACEDRPQPKAFSYVSMATAAQLRGGSLRRQTQLSEQYAAEHGLDLDEDFKLHDIGVSAFDGSNIVHYLPFAS